MVVTLPCAPASQRTPDQPTIPHADASRQAPRGAPGPRPRVPALRGEARGPRGRRVQYGGREIPPRGRAATVRGRDGHGRAYAGVAGIDLSLAAGGARPARAQHPRALLLRPPALRARARGLLVRHVGDGRARGRDPRAPALQGRPDRDPEHRHRPGPGRPAARLPQHLPASRLDPLHRGAGAAPGPEPRVPLSHLDLQPGWAAHRHPAPDGDRRVRPGRLPAVQGRRRHLGRLRLREPGGGAGGAARRGPRRHAGAVPELRVPGPPHRQAHRARRQGELEAPVRELLGVLPLPARPPGALRDRHALLGRGGLGPSPGRRRQPHPVGAAPLQAGRGDAHDGRDGPDPAVQGLDGGRARQPLPVADLPAEPLPQRAPGLRQLAPDAPDRARERPDDLRLAVRAGEPRAARSSTSSTTSPSGTSPTARTRGTASGSRRGSTPGRWPTATSCRRRPAATSSTSGCWSAWASGRGRRTPPPGTAAAWAAWPDLLRPARFARRAGGTVRSATPHPRRPGWMARAASRPASRP